MSDCKTSRELILLLREALKRGMPEYPLQITFPPEQQLQLSEILDAAEREAARAIGEPGGNRAEEQRQLAARLGATMCAGVVVQGTPLTVHADGSEAYEYPRAREPACDGSTDER